MEEPMDRAISPINHIKFPRRLDPVARHVKLLRGLRVQLECFLVMAII
jgi:hypothetical protein